MSRAEMMNMPLWIVVFLAASTLFACGDTASSPRPSLVTDGGADTAFIEQDTLGTTSVDATMEATSADPDAEVASSPCPALCARVEGAACPTQKPCLPACDTAVSAASCGPQYLHWATCAAKEPATLFTCDRRGQGALDATRCDEELKTFGDCLLSGG